MRLSREKTVRLAHQLADLLVAEEDVQFIEDRETIRREIVEIIQSLLRQEEQIDADARKKIASQKKEILEGTAEWEILYRKYYGEQLKRLGIAESP
jgi:hypothetical protein